MWCLARFYKLWIPLDLVLNQLPPILVTPKEKAVLFIWIRRSFRNIILMLRQSKCFLLGKFVVMWALSSQFYRFCEKKPLWSISLAIRSYKSFSRHCMTKSWQNQKKLWQYRSKVYWRMAILCFLWAPLCMDFKSNYSKTEFLQVLRFCKSSFVVKIHNT